MEVLRPVELSYRNRRVLKYEWGRRQHLWEFGRDVWGEGHSVECPEHLSARKQATYFDQSDGQKEKFFQSHIIKHRCPGAHPALLSPSNSVTELPVLNSATSITDSCEKTCSFSPLFYLEIICTLSFFQIIWERSCLHISPNLEQCRAKYSSLSGSSPESWTNTVIHFWVSGCASLGRRRRKRSFFFAVEIKPAEVKHLSSDPSQPKFLFWIWSSQHPAYWIFIIIFRACSQDTSVFVAQWGCQHQALQYQCCFISECSYAGVERGFYWISGFDLAGLCDEGSMCCFEWDQTRSSALYID